ncbi:1,2-phenylacetyl-CoA epoxidase subunit PaaC [Schleiferia thermophila]|jgi:ring-1,2-phenylacetyl-CoA epoxidase subunit PaaC|uniref:Ring-1,2-phenylacetyl-CoA epoxidase subunit PaaC n=1 Tax=Schleiferia thermophila TaxID=884107 RepID=A0A369A7R7_9FLAO|nr:1,2-phenylacetyl-CoA epoxidase subunit PaaC [Schleiferia thermophila]KFD39980.1 phenylacetic acid degradation protein [Schleiferia thermophila str. Yellowstone]RCX05410.1 ring-1,2-phenylacetyl-CoA epoxidase subunit PaaC [Schleiferia thermophila]GCD79084.1 phenylacetic acid degradation protein [Schleiferia thermophila]
MKKNIHTQGAPPLLIYTLRLADNAMILGQRLSEWCGHGPELELDIALSNIALDQLGHARMLYQYAAKQLGPDYTEDDLPFFRDADSFHNLLIVELPNGHWGDTLARQFLFDTYNYFLYRRLCSSADDTIKSIAQKAIKEITYHAQWSAEWVIRLGDGTQESHQKIQKSFEDLWMWTGEFFMADEIDCQMAEYGIGVHPEQLKDAWRSKVEEILDIATLHVPDATWYQRGGKQGRHTEYLGYILAEMQHLPRMYPEAKW